MNIHQLNLSELEQNKDTILALMKEATDYSFPNSEIDSSYFEQKYDELRNYIKHDNAIVFSAIEHEQMVGWLWCHSINRFEKQMLHVAFFSVLPNWRGKGIGKALLLAAEDKAKEMGFVGVDLLVTASNDDAVRFYNCRGYTTNRMLMKKDFNE